MASFDSFSSPAQARGFRRRERTADSMTREYHAFVDSANAAERAGDAATALEYHQGVPMFRRSAHRVALAQLAGLSEEMTPWMWARWAAYQSTRAEGRGTRSGQIVRAALDVALATFHAEDFARAYDDGDDPVRVVARTMGEDWAYHQLCAFELGGLQCFLDTLATGRLAAEAGLARQWVDARMSGYRIESSGVDALVVHDLGTGEPVPLLDLGARVHGATGWLVGRLVPSGTSPARMFDTRPLPVDEATARAVAAGEDCEWVDVLVDAIADGRVDRAVLQSEDRELVTDVPSLDLLRRATPRHALASTMDQLARGRDEVGRAAYRLLRSAAAGALADEDACYVAAAVVNVHGYAEARRQLARSGCQDTWLRWAALAPEPARGRLIRLADLSAAAAA